MWDAITEAAREGHSLIWILGALPVCWFVVRVLRGLGATDEQVMRVVIELAPDIYRWGWFTGLSIMFLLGGVILLLLHIAGVL